MSNEEKKEARRREVEVCFVIHTIPANTPTFYSDNDIIV